MLASQGATVVTASRSGPRKPAEAPLTRGLTPAWLDVRDGASVVELFEWIDRAAGRIDALVVNAGIGIFGTIDALELRQWQEVLDTNLTGAFLCIAQAMKRMTTQRHGRIVAIGSIADHVAFRENAAYAASKFGLRGLVGVVNEEGKDRGVFATLISPGAVATEIWDGRQGFDKSDMLDPQDIARSVAHVLTQPRSVRIDSMVVMPPRGVL
jgi:NADP-dependent 3-hydroxy acid dehydrogenase YdfG